jgi:hypothetical protein
MKNPSNSRRSTAIHSGSRALAPADRRRKARPRVSLSRWKALERDQFRTLVAAPIQHARSKEGRGHW